LITEPVRRAFARVAAYVLGLNHAEVWWAVEAEESRKSPWRRLVYVIAQVYAQAFKLPEDNWTRTWLERTTHARDLLTGLWLNGPQEWATDDLEVAAALQFLSEELHWPQRMGGA
jgi:hypothetical protein